ncbi:GumC family protein [Segetibacter aerophilus]|uniref:non-specific protein-tyrosine kinase n=1 Tax=Segetibacter aerophilus TaxID=670293 RepID=A0A512BD43_9BACT|nr:polysaccharide biosynthesis tyrosine autokinase [Segetibacter aerophilus]GEO09878.1 tyrosine protein kinase [Segetibacter aerophilus]
MQTTSNNKIHKDDAEEDVDFSAIIFKYIVYWPIFLVLIVVTSITAFIYLRYTVPIYEVSASILVKDEKKGIDGSSIMESLDMFGSKKIVENELEVLQSKDLLMQVVNNLKLYAPVYEEGRIKDRPAYIISPVTVELKHPESVRQVQKIKFVFSKGSTIKVTNKKYALNQWLTIGKDTLRFIQNKNYEAPEIEKPLYVSISNAKAVVESLHQQILVSSVNKQATVIHFELKDAIPKRGEDIINELITVYNKAALTDKNILAANTLAFVENRLGSVVKELSQVEGDIEKFKSKKGIVDISQQGKMFLDNVGTNDQKVVEINMQLAVLDQVEKYVVSRNEQAGIVPSTLGINDPVLTQLLQTLYELQLQNEKLRKTTGENNPALIGLQDQIEKVRPNILENVRNQRNSLIAGKNTLTINSNKYTSQLKNVPQNEKELLEISREQAIKNNIYTFLLQKREETALSFASAVADSRVIDIAKSSLLPVSPKKFIVYLIAIAAAIALGSGFLFAKEMLNQNILFRGEIEKAVSWPIIGELSLNDTAEPIVIGEGNRNAISEQLRQMRTSLDFLGINETKKKILVTSTISGEGKSFVSLNLAVSLSLTGKKVVLLEMDLRKPKLSPVLNISSDKGISNYLIGKAEVEEIIKTTTVNENLYFISSGPIPPNPSELILNGRIHDLLEYLSQAFDYIIIDTAPVAPVADAHILSKFCDATLYIIRHGYTPKIHVKRLEENNKVRGLKNVAIIFNGLKGRGFGKYSNNYGYGYAYGYGYGEIEVNSKKVKTTA